MKKLLILLLISQQTWAAFTLGTPDKSCPNGQITITFTTDQTFVNGVTTFNCLVSDASGSFAAPQSVVATKVGATFSIAALPASLPPSANYKIKIQASSPNVLSDESSVFEIVSFPNIPTISPVHTESSPLGLCLNIGSTINVTNIESGVTYRWGYEFGYNGKTTPTLTNNNDIAGNHFYWVDAFKIGTDYVCEGVRSEYTYTTVVDPQAFTAISPNSPISQCPGGYVQLKHDVYPFLGPFTFQWLNNNVPISGETSNVFEPTITGNYSLQVTRETCVAASPQVPVTFSGTPISASFVSPPPSGLLCLNQTLNATTVSGASYEWQRFESTVVSGISFTPTAVHEIGDYRLKVTNGACFAYANFKVLPPPDEALFYATFSDPVAGTPIDLVADILFVEAGNWNYNITDGTTTLYTRTNQNTVQHYSVIPFDATVNYYMTNISNVCGVSASSKSVEVNTTIPPVLSLSGLIISWPSLRVFRGSSAIISTSIPSSGSRVRFESGGSILLSPGFLTDGAAFEARIVP